MQRQIDNNRHKKGYTQNNAVIGWLTDHGLLLCCDWVVKRHPTILCSTPKHRSRWIQLVSHLCWQLAVVREYLFTSVASMVSIYILPWVHLSLHHSLFLTPVVRTDTFDILCQLTLRPTVTRHTSTCSSAAQTWALNRGGMSTLASCRICCRLYGYALSRRSNSITRWNYSHT